MTAGLQMM